METNRKSDLVVIAVARAKPENAHDLGQALREVAGPTRAQPGCVSFSLYRSAEDPCVIVGLERWASKEAHDRHLQGAHVQKLMSQMMPVLAEPPTIVAYQVIDEA